MVVRHHSRFLILGALTWGLVASAPLLAQGSEKSGDADRFVYATGAVFETEAELADRPRTPLFRKLSPPDPSISPTAFPLRGVRASKARAWAGRSATRPAPTTTALPEGGVNGSAPTQIPSPAYIYDSIRRSPRFM